MVFVGKGSTHSVVGEREKLFRRSSLGSTHSVVGEREKLLRRKHYDLLAGTFACNYPHRALKRIRPRRLLTLNFW